MILSLWHKKDRQHLDTLILLKQIKARGKQARQSKIKDIQNDPSKGKRSKDVTIIFVLFNLFHARGFHLASLNGLGEKLCAAIILSNFVKITIKLLLAYSFWEIILIAPNLKHAYVTYSFHELLIFFWSTLVNTFCLKTDLLFHIKEMLYVNNTPNGEIKRDILKTGIVAWKVTPRVKQLLLEKMARIKNHSTFSNYKPHLFNINFFIL